MDASICVTTINGFPVAWHFCEISLCTLGRSQRWTAFPRSPLAITISSAPGSSSSSFRTPSRFSIFAKSFTSSAPASCRAFFTHSRSSRPRTNGCMTPVTPISFASRIFSRSAFVSVGELIFAPGNAALFLLFNSPPQSTFAKYLRFSPLPGFIFSEFSTTFR